MAPVNLYHIIFPSIHLSKVDYAVPTPADMTAAIGDMKTAYSDAAGRTLPDYMEPGAGDISGMDLVPGFYKWGTGVLIDNTGVTQHWSNAERQGVDTNQCHIRHQYHYCPVRHSVPEVYGCQFAVNAS